MVRIDAVRIVSGRAVMTDLQSVRNRPPRQFPRHHRRVLADVLAILEPDMNLSTPCGCDLVAEPRPAGVEPARSVHLGPESRGEVLGRVSVVRGFARESVAT